MAAKIQQKFKEDVENYLRPILYLLNLIRSWTEDPDIVASHLEILSSLITITQSY